MADDQIQEQTERLRKKIEKKNSAWYPNIKEKESTRTIERGKIKKLERHANEIETRREEIQHLKGKVHELMSESCKGIYEVNKWTYKIEEAL